MEIAKRARFIELAFGGDITHVVSIDGVFNAIPDAPVSHQALCIAALVDDPELPESRTSLIDREKAEEVIDPDLFNPLLEDPKYKLFCADLTTAEFSDGDITALPDVATTSQFNAACKAVGLPNLGTLAVTLQTHLIKTRA
jgi:hypothetical protein